jgi:low affinity Fe/Cu permease
MSLTKLLHDIVSIIHHPLFFILTFLGLLAWILYGYTIHFEEWWFRSFELIGITVAILLEVIIEATQRADTKAMQEKLDEIIRVLPKTDEKKIGLEKKLKRSVN